MSGPLGIQVLETALDTALNTAITASPQEFTPDA